MKERKKHKNNSSTSIFYSKERGIIFPSSLELPYKEINPPLCVYISIGIICHTHNEKRGGEIRLIIPAVFFLIEKSIDV